MYQRRILKAKNMGSMVLNKHTKKLKLIVIEILDFNIIPRCKL